MSFLTLYKYELFFTNNIAMPTVVLVIADEQVAVAFSIPFLSGTGTLASESRVPVPAL